MPDYLAMNYVSLTGGGGGSPVFIVTLPTPGAEALRSIVRVVAAGNAHVMFLKVQYCALRVSIPWCQTIFFYQIEAVMVNHHDNSSQAVCHKANESQ